MHHVNYFLVNFYGTAYMGQCISVTDIAYLPGQLCRIYEEIRKLVYITIHSRTAVYLERFSVVLKHFPDLSRASHLLVIKTTFFHDGGCYHIETSPLICSANQWTGYYMITASVRKKLKKWALTSILLQHLRK